MSVKLWLFRVGNIAPNDFLDKQDLLCIHFVCITYIYIVYISYIVYFERLLSLSKIKVKFKF